MQSLSSFMNTIRFNFLYIDKYSFGRTWTYPESAIPYNMLRYIIDGSAEFVVDGETVIVGAYGQKVKILSRKRSP